jgi:radical SAM protein with 4Fe4S-binding SPASM domain
MNVFKKLAVLKKRFNFEPGYFRLSGNPLDYFLQQGNLIAHLNDRIKFRLFPKFGIIPRFPTHIDIESASSCQMKCPMCYTTYLEPEKKGIMKFDLYQKIIDQAVAGKSYSVKISWRGEPLLNNRILDMVKYAKGSGIKEVAMLSNGELLTPKLAEQLVDAGLDWISFSADGMGEVYEKIRAPAKFHETVDKVAHMRNYRDKKKLKKPLIRVQSILSAIKDDPDAFIRAWDGVADRVNGIADEARDLELAEMNHDSAYLCPTPWARITIAHDGKIHQCKVDYDRKMVMGDVNEQSIYEIWHGENFQSLRNAFKESKALEQYSACNYCTDNVLTEERPMQVNGKALNLGKFAGIRDVVNEGHVATQSERRSKSHETQ